ncbi:MAG: hypothetical protein Q8O89_01795 [Nanoarchaeota archaeon]|nr:hypothetical protein [Nanoarchaeota archaeon]
MTQFKTLRQCFLDTAAAANNYARVMELREALKMKTARSNFEFSAAETFRYLVNYRRQYELMLKERIAAGLTKKYLAMIKPIYSELLMNMSVIHQLFKKVSDSMRLSKWSAAAQEMRFISRMFISGANLSQKIKTFMVVDQRELMKQCKQTPIQTCQIAILRVKENLRKAA